MTAFAGLRDRFRLLAEALFEDMGPGISLAVARGGEVVWTVTRGMACVHSGRPVTDRTRFDTGSASKVVTGGALLEGIRQGRLDLNHRVGRYLPQFAAHPGLRGLTLQHLNTHRSGLPDYLEFMEGAALSALDLRELPQLLLDRVPSELEVGVFRYSNSNYALLALVLEEVFACGLLDVPTPGDPARGLGAGMADHDREGRFTLTREDGADCARGYRSDTLSFHEAEPWELRCGIYGDGGLWSTPSGLALFLDHLLTDPTTPTLTQAFEASVVGDLPPYAFGLMREEPAGGSALYLHEGAWPGFSSLVGWEASQGVALAVCSNLAYVPMGAFAHTFRRELARRGG